MIKLSLSVITILTFIFQSNAQTQGVAYTAVGKGVATTFVTDYHSLGVNSSALGWGTGYEGKKFTMGMTEFSLGIYSDNLSSDKLSSLYQAIRNEVTGKEQATDSWATQAENAADYLQTGISIDATYNWFGASFQNEKFGGIAVNIQEQYNWYSKLSADVSGITFQGKFSDYFDQLTVVYGTDTTTISNSGNISNDTLEHVVAGTLAAPLSLAEVTNGTDIKFSWNRYYNIGYGRKLFGDSTFALYAGIGGRFIQSTAMFNFTSDDDGLSLQSSVSPNFDINYGSIANSNPTTFTDRGKSIPTSVGSGYGLDFSVSAILFKRLKIGAAVNNIGSVTYNRNVYNVRDTLVGEIALDGLSNNNVTNAMDIFLKEGGLLNLVGAEKIKVANAATFRVGGSIDFGKKASIGVDFVAPFNRDNPGSIENAVFSIGGEIKPLKWLALSAGYYGGGIYKSNIPVGINFILGDGTYEFGISSRDALAFFTKGSNSVSTAFGVMRFRF